MPFTVAHAAAVLPFRRWTPRPFHFSALVVGSFAPDLPYYLPLTDRSGHDFMGSFVVALPFGAAMLALLYAIRFPSVWLLPSPHRQAVMPVISVPERYDAAWLLRVFVSLEIGIWIHIAWDGFTHRNRAWVRGSALLRQPVRLPVVGEIEVFRILQHASTIVGLLLLLVAYTRFVRCAKVSEDQSDRWRIRLLVAMTLIAAAVAVILPLRDPSLSMNRLIFHAVTTFVAAFGALFAVAVAVAAIACRRYVTARL